MLLAALLGAPLAAQPVFLSDEVQVNLGSRSRERDPIAVQLDDGRSLVVWQEDRHGIYGRLLDAAGTPVGDDLALAPSDALSSPFSGVLRVRTAPAAAVLENGDVLLAWTEEQQLVYSVPFYERRVQLRSAVYTRLLRPDAVAEVAGGLSAPVRVSGARGGLQRDPQLALLPDGRVLAAWTFEQGEVTGLRARVLSAAGRLDGPALLIDAAPDSKPGGLTLTAHPSGSVLAAWQACCDAGEDLGVFASVLDVAQGVAGPVVRINDLEENQQSRPAVAVLAGGDYLVTWQSSTGIPEPLYDGWRVRGQRVSAEGSLLGPASQLSDGYGWGHTRPDLGVGTDGGVLLAWLAWSGDFPVAVLARELDDQGTPLGEPFLVSTSWAYGSPSVTTLAGDRTLISWISIMDRRGVSVRLLGETE